MMIKNLVKVTVFLAAVLSVDTASAYTEDKEKPICKAPKFRDFNLPVYSAENKSEVAPGAELVFTISDWSDPRSISVTAKGIPLEVNVEDKKSFFRVTAELPASLAGKFARINASVHAVLGCRGESGWLVKVADSHSVAPAADAEATVEKAATETIEKGEENKADETVE